MLGDREEAIFETSNGNVTVAYDFLHVVPPMGPHQFLAESPLVDAQGYVDVDKQTLQHQRFPNIFALGDASNLPTAKTAAAAVSQATIATANLMATMEQKPMLKTYEGYAGCPITVTSKTVIMAEFGYDGVPMETMPFIDQRKPSMIWAFMKRIAFPIMYWHGILNGLWRGSAHLDLFFDGRSRQFSCSSAGSVAASKHVRSPSVVGGLFGVFSSMGGPLLAASANFRPASFPRIPGIFNNGQPSVRKI